jgi:carbamoylphosphate synthase small subunit
MPRATRPKVSASTFASCGINYADGSVWKQTVTVTSDNHGNPVADSVNLETEVLQPTDGQL